MRGFEALIPSYPKDMLVAEDLAYWEATYDDGHVVRESYGGSYSDLERNRLTSFRIIHGGEIIFEAFVPTGATGRNLLYRRRTAIAQEGGGRGVIFVLGWHPMGPAFAIDVSGATYRVREEGFAASPAEDAQLYMPVFTPEEARLDDLTSAS